MARLIPIALALVSLSFQEAWATTPTAELRAFFADATLILTDPETDGKHAERLGAIRAITRQIFDVREAAKLALGPAWRDRSEAEREEFAHLYGDFLERAFIAWIAARAQIDGGPRVSFLGESVEGGQATVRTTVLGRNGRDLPLEYRMVERGDRWAVSRRRDRRREPGGQLPRPVHQGHPEAPRIRSWCSSYGTRSRRRRRRSSPPPRPGGGTSNGAGGSRAGRPGAAGSRTAACDRDDPRHRCRPPDGCGTNPADRSFERADDPDVPVRDAIRRDSDRAEPTSDDGQHLAADIAVPVLLGPGRRVQELRARPCAWHPSCERRRRWRRIGGPSSWNRAPPWRGCASDHSPTAPKPPPTFASSHRAASNPSSPKKAGTPDEIRRQGRIDLGGRSGHRPGHGGHHRPRGRHRGGGRCGARRARPAHRGDRRRGRPGGRDPGRRARRRVRRGHRPARRGRPRPHRHPRQCGGRQHHHPPPGRATSTS